MFTDKVAVCGGIGPEYLPRHEKWYKDNGVSTEGLVLRSDISPTMVIHDYPDGSRTDEPNIGLKEFRALDPSPDEVFRCCDQNTKGVYVFKDVERDYLDASIGGKLRVGHKLMWEISEDACRPENIDVIEAYLKDIDVFSINRHEACLLYGTTDEEEAQRRFWRLLQTGYFLEGVLRARICLQVEESINVRAYQEFRLLIRPEAEIVLQALYFMPAVKAMSHRWQAVWDRRLRQKLLRSSVRRRFLQKK